LISMIQVWVWARKSLSVCEQNRYLIFHLLIARGNSVCVIDRWNQCFSKKINNLIVACPRNCPIECKLSEVDQHLSKCTGIPRSVFEVCSFVRWGDGGFLMNAVKIQFYLIIPFNHLLNLNESLRMM
jgi:hypothetical protein